jgi:hypothetical protein
VVNHIIVGIHITNRVKHVPEVQKVLTEFGCNIKTRLGLHELGNSHCSPNGLLLIEFAGELEKSDEFVAALKKIEGVETQKMVFSH